MSGHQKMFQIIRRRRFTTLAEENKKNLIVDVQTVNRTAGVGTDFDAQTGVGTDAQTGVGTDIPTRDNSRWIKLLMFGILQIVPLTTGIVCLILYSRRKVEDEFKHQKILLSKDLLAGDAKAILSEEFQVVGVGSMMMHINCNYLICNYLI